MLAAMDVIRPLGIMVKGIYEKNFLKNVQTTFLMTISRASLSNDIKQSHVKNPNKGCPYDVSEENSHGGEKINQKLKDFGDIPGPLSLPLVGTLWKYLPIIGEYSFNALHKNSWINYERYGPLVRETIVPGVDILQVFDPDDIEVVLRSSGKYPERRSHVALERYRKERPEVYNSGGLLPTNGEEWWQIRSLFQKPLSSPKNAQAYIGITDSVVNEFVQRVRHRSSGTDKGKPDGDFLLELSRLNLQLLCIIAFDVRLSSFTPEELLPDSLSSKLIHATITSNSCTMETDYIPESLKYITPAYRKLCNAQQYLEQVAVDFVSQKMAFYNDNVHKEDDKDREPSLLESYLSNSDIDLKDIVGMSVDLLLAGIDTTSFTTSFALYHLARNPRAQEVLYKEAVELLPNPEDTVTVDILNRAPYLKACLKESLRLNPVAIGIGRSLTQDIVLSGYHIPKGVVAVTQNLVACNLPKYFDEPKKFLPERWVRGSEFYKQNHPFVCIPFGHGSRMCIARRLAEQNMQITIMKLVRNFHISWKSEDLGIISIVINKPDKPVKLSFEARNNL